MLDEYDDTILSIRPGKPIVKGELIHAVLKNLFSNIKMVDLKTSELQSVISEYAERIVTSRFGKSMTNEQAMDLLAQITDNVKNAFGTLREIAPNFSEMKIYTEQTITRRFGSDFLTGTLDLLTEDEKGFHIFDYKTNRLDKGLDKIYSAYEIQMKLYASLCSRLKLEQNDFDVTIIFTREAGTFD